MVLGVSHYRTLSESLNKFRLLHKGIVNGVKDHVEVYLPRLAKSDLKNDGLLNPKTTSLCRTNWW